MLFLFIVGGWLIVHRKQEHSFLYSFIIIYSIFSFMYYLRSPGYLRYILIAELLILFVLPHTVRTIFPLVAKRANLKVISTQVIVWVIIIFFVLLQTIQMFTVADISSSSAPHKVGAFIENNFKNSSISLLSSPEVSLFTNPEKTFLTLDLLGLPTIGTNPLFTSELPEIVVSRLPNRFIDEKRDIIEKKYVFIKNLEGYTFYVLQK